MRLKPTPLILGSIFTSLASIHFYWSNGGTWAINNVFPTKLNGDLVLSPSSTDTAIVGIELLIIAIHYFSRANLKFKIPYLSSKFIG